VSSHPFQPVVPAQPPKAPLVGGDVGRDQPAAKLPTQAHMARLEILVVDDDAATRDGLSRAIRSFGHACRAATDGFDALRQLEERPADVVISDWNMPGMSGPELCKRTRSAGDEAPYTYFIILTGLHDREHLLAGMEAGADDYQKKPVDLDELEARLVSASRVVELHRRLATRTAALRHDSTRFYAASRTDALTGAGNRLRLNEELEALISRAERYGHKCSLAICDLDYFKSFNDQLGHVAGDEALRQVAEAMRKNLRSSDALYRYGGEEFVVLLIEQPLSDAVCAMDRMRAEVERLALPSPRTGGSMTVSVGVAEIDPTKDRTPADLVARADAALYAAKARGRNRVVSTAQLDG